MSLAEDLESVLIETAENNDFGSLKAKLEAIKAEDITPNVKKVLDEGAQLAFESADCSSTDAIECALKVCAFGAATGKVKRLHGKCCEKSFRQLPGSSWSGKLTWL